MLDLSALIDSHVGSAIARLRITRGWRIEDLATACGLDSARLRAVEAGQEHLAEAERLSVARVLGIHPDGLYDDLLDALRDGLWPSSQARH
ncbi:helix-turn-helix domain-containing protein [Roseospira visakhapatnamensis]|uniref:Transcriptional regulator with XRE-family HTH domain n=1 Tax=Roseospira visakhapatnamensis TaxID=390880 RepID=A0A7W6RCA6_9PROT|nr:helix-turn-helix transcriptional regulator [Roseospira visakhapatnamensis]MBB4265884.1 transcriptional regulator with XRE-family HTH domain [Roseospira visakhapatnamensis]